MKTVSKEEIEKGYADLWEFKYGYYEYKKCTKLRGKLIQLFGSDVKAAYHEIGKTADICKSGIDISNVSVLFVNAKGKLVCISNSEWCGINFE